MVKFIYWRVLTEIQEAFSLDCLIFNFMCGGRRGGLSRGGGYIDLHCMSLMKFPLCGSVSHKFLD